MIDTHRPGLKDMTYILGADCADGVVLVGDRKVTLDDGAAHTYEDKLFVSTAWMVVGSSGISGLFEKFRDKLSAYLATPEYDNNVYTLTSQIEIITRGLNETYHEILRGQVFDVLIGIKSTVKAELKYVYPIGFAEGVRRYKAIGRGEPYGSFFLKRWWHKDMTMLEVAELGFFIIKYIQELELDNTVGIGDGYPQVWLIPHKQISPKASPKQNLETVIKGLVPKDMAPMKDRVRERLAKFKEQADSCWSI
jgi:20S proteasome alpha/beta subunit